MTVGYYHEPKRTIGERISRALGFGFPAVPDDLEEAGMAPGRIVIEIHTKFDFADRLRLLITGKLVTVSSVKTDVVVKTAITQTKTAVLA